MCDTPAALRKLFDAKGWSAVREMILEYSKQSTYDIEHTTGRVYWIASKRGPEFLLSCSGLQEAFEEHMKLNIEEIEGMGVYHGSL
ncbi:hypothetical protein [Bacillus altitudinis]|uniref:hypothetical protein n=1 Tax=Bacillus altitudinis TaxID=293387 RepID=UPI00366DFBA3